MKTHIPDELKEKFNLARAEADKSTLHSLILGTREAGYSYAEIAEPLEISRSAVNQWYKTALASGATPTPIPKRIEPPKEPKGTPRKIKPDVPAAEREHLRRTAEAARRNTRWSREDSPERRASYELQRLIETHVLQRKVPVAAFARHAGVTRRAIMQRVERFAPRNEDS